MSFISQKSQAIPRSAIREMFGMQVGLDNIVSFAMGEPDFKTPQHIVDAEIASLKRGETHYTPNEGIMPLREAISDSYRARGLDYAPREILISPGAISALLLTAMVTLDIGDEVLVPDPGWANYMGLIMQVGAKPIPVRVLEKNGFMYDVNELRAAVTDRTKLILINSPSNPTGGVADAENLRQIADLAKEKNLFVLTDEIYRELLWTEEPFTSIAGFPGMKERTVIVDGFSKTYAMTGLRLGYAAAPEDVIVSMTKLLENVWSSVNEGAQWAGVAALTGDRAPVEEMKRRYRHRRKLMVDGLCAIDGIGCVMPKGAFYAFANIQETGLSSREFAIRLLQEKHVVVAPGSGFGEGGEGFVRLSYATGEDNIAEGLARIGEFVKSIHN